MIFVTEGATAGVFFDHIFCVDDSIKRCSSFSIIGCKYGGSEPMIERDSSGPKIYKSQIVSIFCHNVLRDSVSQPRGFILAKTA